MKSFTKDPSATLDYQFDWRAKTHGVEGAESDWLATSETISSYSVKVQNGITLDSDNESGGAVTVWISGGTAGRDYAVRCRITTSSGRTDDRTLIIRVRNR